MCSNDNVDERISRIVNSSPAELTRNSTKSNNSSISSESKTALFNSASSSSATTNLFHQLQQNHSYQRQQYNRLPGQASSSGTVHHHHHYHPTTNMSSMLGGNSIVPPGILPPLDHYRLQLYNYAVAERLRCSQYNTGGQLQICGPGYPSAAATAAAAAVSAGGNPYAPSRFALSMSFFHNRVFQPEEPKPQHSYIGLIAMAILNSPETKLVLSDIYQHILDNYPYFRTRGPGWRNSIRHNLSLNDCFIKAGRSANGKGHYWAIHPANLEDFKKGDFRRRKAQRKVRKHMGLAVDDEGTDSSSPPPLAVTPPPTGRPQPGLVLDASTQSAFCAQSWAAAAAAHVQAQAQAAVGQQSLTSSFYSQSSRKRQFDVASLLAPDEDEHVIHRSTRSPSFPFVDNPRQNRQFQQSQQAHDSQHLSHLKGSSAKRLSLGAAQYNESENEEDIDVVASDVENNNNNATNNQDDAIDRDNSPLLLPYNEDEESTTGGEELHKEDIIDTNSANQQHQQQQQRQLESQHQRQQSPVAAPMIFGDEDNALAESSSDSNPMARAAAAAAAAASWHGIIQQWPGNFQQHLNNVSPNVNTQILQRYYGQYMAAAAAQQAAAAANTSQTSSVPQLKTQNTSSKIISHSIFGGSLE
ncbi:forkhead box protein C1-B [Hermetia illucens]|uniref:forkhead box protein C1-B n=1 Tax=Hermetia illucens TaxID=343691 RepID=UPI0018CC1385|nr:forkhead box protein C1-B [Hermetia illucens]